MQRNWRSREQDTLIWVNEETYQRLKARWDAGEWTVCVEDDTTNVVDLIATLDR